MGWGLWFEPQSECQLAQVLGLALLREVKYQVVGLVQLQLDQVDAGLPHEVISKSPVVIVHLQDLLIILIACLIYPYKKIRKTIIRTFCISPLQWLLLRGVSHSETLFNGFI